eukprot:COSAG04_NODE_833_length_10004_cov_6.351035_12_plen_132_part_00
MMEPMTRCAGIDTADIRDEYGIPFQTFYVSTAAQHLTWRQPSLRCCPGCCWSSERTLLSPAAAALTQALLVGLWSVQGISANYNKFWSISNARRVIGYEPQDNALVKYSTQVAEFIAQAKETSAAKETSSL